MFVQRTPWIFLVLLVVLHVMPILVEAQQSQEEANFGYGQRLFHEKLFDLALIQFQNFVEEFRDSPNAHQAVFNLGVCHFELGQFKEAQKTYTTLIVRYPDAPTVPEAHFQIAVCFQRLHQYRAASASFNRVAVLFPESPWADEALFRSAKLAALAGDLQLAESRLKRLSDQTQNATIRSEAAFLMADLSVRQGRTEDALHSLATLIQRPFRPSDAARAAFGMGQIYEQMGQWQNARDQFNHVTTIQPDDTLLTRSFLALGRLQSTAGLMTDAEASLRQAVKVAPDTDLRHQTNGYLADILFQIQDYTGSLEAFRIAEGASDSVDTMLEYQLGQGRCLAALNRHDEAILQFQTVADAAANYPEIGRRAYLYLAATGIKSKQWTMAVRALETTLARFPDDRTAPYVLVRLGQILIDELDFIDGGFDALRKIWDRYPQSSVLPQARLIYARGLEKAGREQEALRIYRMISETYRGTRWSDLAGERAEVLSQFIPVQAEEGMARLAEAFEKGTGKLDQIQTLSEIGDIFFDDLKSYDVAARYYRRIVDGRGDNQDGFVLQARYRLARCDEILFLKDRDPDRFRRAKQVYARLVSHAPQSSWGEQASVRLLMLSKETLPPDSIRRAAHTLLDRYPSGKLRDAVLFQLGVASAQVDSLNDAEAAFLELIRMHADSPRTEEAMVQLARILVRRDRSTSADSVLAVCIDRYPGSVQNPEMQYRQASSLLVSGRSAEAIPIFEKIIHTSYASQWADSAVLSLGKACHTTEQFKKAVSVFETALDQYHLESWAADVGLLDSAPPKAFYPALLGGLARAQEGLGAIDRAESTCLELGRAAILPEDHALAYMALSRIAEAQGRIAQAVSYLEEAESAEPSDTLAAPLGRLYFRLGRYDEAEKAFERAVGQAPSDNSKAFLISRVIISLLRQGKISKADVRTQLLNQTFQKRVVLQDILAEILLEKGKSYIAQKSFNSAQKALREVIDKYKSSPCVPDAEMEMGRVYLITNKIDDALKVLTDMPVKYPNHKILSSVYLNLGVHYFQSQQSENALRAFKMALEDSSNTDVVSAAMRYLIRVYDSLRMWDAALAMVRSYIAKYPYAEDKLQKQVQIGTLYMKLNEYARAIEVFQNAKQNADPETEAEIQYWIAKSHYRMGHFEQAIFEYLKVVYLSQPTKLPWGTTALYEAAQAYLRLNKNREARGLFERIVQREGATSDLGRIARSRIQEIDAADAVAEKTINE